MLYSHQLQIINFVRSTPRALCICPCGAGKTRAILEAFDRAFVIAPLRVARLVWPEEAEAVGKRCGVIRGGVCGNPSAAFYVTNFENAAHLNDFIVPKTMNTLVIDESSKLKSFQFRQGGKRAKLLHAFAKRFDRIVLLTGTPCSESLGDLYSQISFLDDGATFGRSKPKFMQRYHMNVSRSPKYPIWRPLPNAKDDVLKACESFCRYFEPTIETFGSSVQSVVYPLDSNQKASLRRLKGTQLLEIGDAACYACNRAVLAGRLLQAASGFYYAVDKRVIWESTARIDTLKELLDEIGERCVVVAYWRASIDAILSAVTNVTGDVLAFKNGAARHLVINPASAGHGLSLQRESNHMILYEPFFSCEQYEQVVERIGERRQAQSGLNRVAYYHFIQSDVGPDRAAFQALRDKADAEAAIIDYFRNLARSLK